MADALRRERSNSRRAKELQLYVMGYKSHWSRQRTRERLMGGGVGLMGIGVWGALTGEVLDVQGSVAEFLIPLRGALLLSGGN